MHVILQHDYQTLRRSNGTHLFLFDSFLDSIVVSIPACHAGDPGSIPGRGVYFFLFNIHANREASINYLKDFHLQYLCTYIRQVHVNES